MMRTMENLWTTLAFASIVAFVVINVLVSKRFDVYRKSPYQAEQKK